MFMVVVKIGLDVRSDFNVHKVGVNVWWHCDFWHGLDLDGGNE